MGDFMKKISIIQSVSVIVLLILFFVSFTFAWITYFEGVDGAILPIGDIDYTYTGEFIDENEIIYPGLNLIEVGVSVDNQSNIDTQLRVKIEYTLIEETTSVKIYKDEVTDDLDVVFDSIFVQDGDYWYYQATDFDIVATGTIDLLSEISYDGFNSSIEYAGEDISVTIQIQVKQSQHVDWTDLVTFDFTTGEEITE